jgi:RNA-directed DNA polymerase
MPLHLAPPSAPDVLELRSAMSRLQTARDVAQLLQIPYDRFVFHVYRNSPEKQYLQYSVPKRRGGARVISAPNPVIKRLQRRLLPYLAALYTPKPATHGFVSERSILSNARQHTQQEYVLNLDLSDFFKTINRGRVYGMLMGPPYRLPQKVAAVLMKLCTYDNQLPQGAPTSPLISNMICARMDDELQRLARKNHCVYTRFADDLTFSTNALTFPAELAYYASVGDAQGMFVGDPLITIIERNGFKINLPKFRLQHRTRRQEVTGLTVNVEPNVSRKYVMQIRSMLHAWRKHGLAAAEQQHRATWSSRKHRPQFKASPPFHYVVKGKLLFLRMVKGEHSPAFVRYWAEYEELYARDVRGARGVP